MELTIKIQAPEIASAIQAMAKAIEASAKESLSAKNAMATTITVLADQLEENTKGMATEQVAATAEPEEEKAPASEETPADVKPEAPKEEAPTIVELRAKAQEKGKNPESKKAIKALLDEFGCKSISNVPEEIRAEFMHRLEAL